MPVYADYRKLVDELVLDGIIIALPNQMHREAVEICSKKCASLLVEKPIAESVTDGAKIMELCRQSKTRLLVGHHRRFSSQLNCLKKLIESGGSAHCAVSMDLVWAITQSLFCRMPGGLKRGRPLLINGHLNDIDSSDM